MGKKNKSNNKSLAGENLKNATCSAVKSQIVNADNTENVILSESDDSLAEKNSDKTDYENRRSLRITTILAIVTIIGVICVALYNVSKEVLNREPISGSGYYIFTWFMFVTVLSCALIILYDIVIYIWKEISRYDVKDKEHGRYDDESDNSYHKLKKDFIFSLTILALIFVAFLFVFVYNWKLKILAGVIAIIILILILYTSKKRNKLHIPDGTIKYCFYQLVTLLIIACIVFIIVAVSNNIRRSNIEIEYDSSGIVTTSHTSNKAYESLEVNLYQTTQEEPISHKKVGSEELLYAKSMVYKKETINLDNEVSESQSINGAELYWCFSYDIKKLGLSDGSYIIEIISEQGMGKTQILNMFTIENGHYEFGRERIEKSY